MKKDVKLMLQSIKEKNIRVFLNTLNILLKEDIEAIDEQTGLNLVHYCSQENASKELLLIINHFPDLNLNTKSKGIVQKSSLDMAFSMGNKEVAKVLIQGGAILPNPKEAKKTFKNDSIFAEIVDDAIQRTMPEKKKKGFFSFG